MQQVQTNSIHFANIFTFVGKYNPPMRTLFFSFCCMLMVLLLHSCANEGSPTGGPKDEKPPVFIKSTPLPDALNFDGKRVVITFDENIVLKDLFSNFIASPPLENEPVVKTVGNTLRVDLNNELQPNTTYTLYFGTAVVDNNEGNPYESFTFSFSTGEYIDSLMMSGIILDARTLNPVENTLVALYSNLEDSAVVTTVPVRIAKSNKEGIFTVRNLPDTVFHVFGLNDVVKDYKYMAGGEEFAFLEKTFQPYFDTIQLVDTVWADSITVDTILFSDTIVYYPDDIVLMLFKEDRLVQSLKKKTRTQPHLVELEFASSVVELPTLQLLDTVAENWFFYEPSITRDTLLVWLTDTAIYKRDTLNVSLTYQVTDSLENLVWQTDTLLLTFKEKKKAETRNRRKDKDEADEPEPIPMLGYTSSLKSKVDINQPIVLVFEAPVETFNPDSIRLFQVKDTVETQVKFKITQDTVIPRRFFIRYPWDDAFTYKFLADSVAFTSIYGTHTDDATVSFSIKGRDQFGEIFMTLENIVGSGYVEMVNKSDEVLRRQPFTAKQNKVHFEFVQPGTVYLRLFIDENNNGKWDTGSYEDKVQPEKVFYLNKALEIKQNWTIDETWDVFSVPLYDQRPLEMRKSDSGKKR